MKKIIFTLLAASVLVACTEDGTTSEPAPVYQGKTTTVDVGTEAGDYNFNITSSGDWSAAPADSASKLWLEVTGEDHGSGDATITVHYRENMSLARVGRIAVKLTGTNRVDTIAIRQRGILPHIDFVQKNTSVYPVGGKVRIGIDTNIKGSQLENVSIAIVAEQGGSLPEWIEKAEIEDGEAVISVKPYVVARDEHATATPRTGSLQLCFVDAWGDHHEVLGTISQTPMPPATEKTFAEIRALATVEGYTIEDNLTVRGFVVSDPESENVAGNLQTGNNKFNYSVNPCTVYIEAEDGSSGMMFSLSDADQNIFERGSLVTVTLSNTTVTKFENPTRYVVSGLGANALFGNEEAVMPVKEKYIGELTDDDIYTYVTLKDCEFPIREGSYTPINEGYGQLFNSQNLDKYPLPVIDMKGGSLYMLTNLGAPWRRNGSAVPAGTGNLSGVIVHETFTQYDYVDEKGYIGRYQIRPISKEDIKVDATRRQSMTIVEWSSMLPNMIVDGKLQPNYGNGELYHESAALVSNCITQDFSALGPYEGTEAGSNRGQFDSSAIRQRPWWDSTNNCGIGWVAAFSTKDITAKNVVLALSVLNSDSEVGAPRFWKVQWSEHGDRFGEWNDVENGSYTVPDIANWNYLRVYSLAGDKGLTVQLPTDILNKEKVYIRLIPTSNEAGKASYGGYLGGTSGNKWNRIAYLSIQYNN